MSDWFLKQLINIKFCVKLERWKTWCFQHDPESKQQTSPQHKKVCMLKSCMKTMLITFFDMKAIAHFEFILQGQTVNQANIEILKWLCEPVHRRRPEFWPSD
jgi:hypothetical protein